MLHKITDATQGIELWQAGLLVDSGRNKWVPAENSIANGYALEHTYRIWKDCAYIVLED